MLSTLSRKSVTADAIGYAMNQWQVLIRHLDDGRIEIDNNAAQRALRTVALGRKNFLFLGSDSGGERAATMYSFARYREIKRYESRSLTPRQQTWLEEQQQCDAEDKWACDTHTYQPTDRLGNLRQRG